VNWHADVSVQRRLAVPKQLAPKTKYPRVQRCGDQCLFLVVNFNIMTAERPDDQKGLGTGDCYFINASAVNTTIVTFHLLKWQRFRDECRASLLVLRTLSLLHFCGLHATWLRDSVGMSLIRLDLISYFPPKCASFIFHHFFCRFT